MAATSRLLVPAVGYGADPELFLRLGDRLVDSGFLLPENGVRTAFGTIARDGLQVELQPLASTMLPMFRTNVGSSLAILNQMLKSRDAELRLDWSSVLDLERENKGSLSAEALELLCHPSLNVYNLPPLELDGHTYHKRSAGGHMHFDLTRTPLYSNGVDERSRLVPFLDLFVGNTCVLLDRDPMASVRREAYGRPGEYRVTEYGLEYRVLSNFWLASPVLMELVYGLANIAIAALSDTVKGFYDYEGDLIKRVDIWDVVKAINTNDYHVALTNFEVVLDFIGKHSSNYFVLHSENTGSFVDLLKIISKDEGLDKLFPPDWTVDAWGGKQRTFSDFLGE